MKRKKSEKILIVEDEAVVAMEIDERLRDLHYNICGMVSSGEAALREIEKTAPDLVLMDIMLKGDMDGIETAGRIRRRFNIPVVYLTAYADQETLQRAKISEPFGYILKPFNERELHIAIEMALYKHSLEKKLAESREWFATTLKSIGDAVITTDRDGTVTFMNPVAEALTGWNYEGAAGRPLEEIVTIVDENKTVSAENLITTALTKGGITALSEHAALIAKDGTIRPVTGVSTSLKNNTGDIIGVVMTFQDISDRRRAEKALKKLTEDLIRSNKDLEHFAYIASHDLQEPLRMVSSFVSLLEQRYKGKLDADADDFIHFAVDGAHRMQKMIEGLLAYSCVGSQAERFITVDCNAVVDTAISDLKMAIKESGAIIKRDHLPTVMGDKNQLVQLFQNLISNAIKFKGLESPRIHIAAESSEKEWIFSISDNGIGIDPQYFDSIFKMFRRLHPVGEYAGSGIGLAVCKRIAEHHNGRIWIESKAGKGSTFYFTVPRRGS